MEPCAACRAFLDEACRVLVDDIYCRNLAIDVHTACCPTRTCRPRARRLVGFRTRPTRGIARAVRRALGPAQKILLGGYVTLPNLAARLPCYLRRRAFEAADLRQLRWLQRRFSSEVTVGELLTLARLAGAAWTPGHMRCFTYMEMWMLAQPERGRYRGAWRQRRPPQAAAVLIQRGWRRAISDPGFAACRRRLLREYGALTA